MDAYCAHTIYSVNRVTRRYNAWNIQKVNSLELYIKSIIQAIAYVYILKQFIHLWYKHFSRNYFLCAISKNAILEHTSDDVMNFSFWKVHRIQYTTIGAKIRSFSNVYSTLLIFNVIFERFEEYLKHRTTNELDNNQSTWTRIINSNVASNTNSLHVEYTCRTI